VRDEHEKVRSQIDIYNYLYQKAVPAEASSAAVAI
jgi:hypothetical protein